MSPEDNNKKFEIGQVAYVLSNKTQKIVPVLIVEKTTVESIEDKKASWKVALGPAGEKRQVVEASKLNGEMFTSLQEIEEHLKRNLTNFINKVISEAKRNETAWYTPEKQKVSQQPPQQILPEQKNSPTPPPSPEKLDPESLIDEMGSDNNLPIQQHHHVDSSQKLQENLSQYTEDQKKVALRQKLRNDIAPDPNELQKDVEIIPENTVVRKIVGPGGVETPIDFKV